MAQIFSNSRNVVISGSPTFNTILGVGDSIDEGLRILCDHAAPGALHNSGERFDPPNCHPKTRIAVRQEIMNWIDDANFPVMWMNGAMGGGKSSIAQALAELYHQRRQLSGSFFFARASDTRNDEKRLVATLAYQMWIEMPHTQSYISACIRRNPLIFESSLKQQCETLIIAPHLHSADSDASPSSKPRLIIIDGLDECGNRDAQGVIVKAFVSSIAAHQGKLPFQLKILIVSRPEVNIKAAFCDPRLSPFVKPLLLNERWLPDNDIRRFLLDSFEKIRSESRHDPQKTTLPEDWPPIRDIERLVERSSGQFIYASVVIKFLQSPRNHPIHSLEVIVNLIKDDNSRPYAQLDVLYQHVFSQVKDLPLVLRILFLFLKTQNLSIIMVEDILDLRPGMLKVALTDLVSVLSYNTGIQFYHASISEFLQDEDRSGRLYVNSREIRADIICRCIPFNKNAGLQQSIDNRLRLFQSLYGYSSAAERSLLCNSLSNMDIMPALEGLKYDYVGPIAATNYLVWLFNEHLTNSMAKLPNSLGNAVKLCAEYILRQYKAFPFRSLDQANHDGVIANMWIFARSPRQRHMPIPAEVLSVLTNSDSSEFERLQKSPPADFCWRILHSIPHDILSDVQLFGEYAMTGDRYADAALCFFKAMPKMNVSSNNDPFHHRILCHGCGVISELLRQTPPSRSLFKFFRETMVTHTSGKISKHISLQELAYRYFLSVFNSIGHDCHSSEVLASVFSDYMERTRKAIPNIDSIIGKGARKAEALRRKLCGSLRELFKGKKGRLILQFRGGSRTP